MASAINATSAELIEQIPFWDTTNAATVAAYAPNVVRPAGLTGAVGLPSQVSDLIHFKLASGQALVVTVRRDPDAGYQGLQTATVWGETLGYATHQSSLNADQAQVSSDGLIQYVVSATDPGVPNWIDTDGHEEGFASLRWQLITGPFTEEDQPSGQLVSLSQLRSVLPADTPTVTPYQRAISLALRSASIARRELLSSNPAAGQLNNYLAQIEQQVGPDALHTLYPSYVPFTGPFGSAPWNGSSWDSGQ